VFEVAHEPARLGFLGTTMEVIGAEVLVEGPVLQDMVDGREYRCGDGANCLLGATPGTLDLIADNESELCRVAWRDKDRMGVAFT